MTLFTLKQLLRDLKKLNESVRSNRFGMINKLLYNRETGMISNQKFKNKVLPPQCQEAIDYLLHFLRTHTINNSSDIYRIYDRQTRPTQRQIRESINLLVNEKCKYLNSYLPGISKVVNDYKRLDDIENGPDIFLIKLYKSNLI